MHVMVTGVSGLVGNAVCRCLLNNNVSVSGGFNTGSTGICDPRFSEFRTDFSLDGINLELPCEAVVHCAAVIPGRKTDDGMLYRVNQKIDETVFSFCQRKKIKLVYISTAYIYDNAVIGRMDEDSPLAPSLEGYYRSKKDSEDFVQNSRIDYTIFRLSSPYGDIRKQTNVMKIFAEKIKENLPVTLIGDGERRQNFIHTDDIAAACLCALRTDKKGLYNVTYDKSYTMLELAEHIKNVYSSESVILFDMYKAEAKMNLEFDNSRIKKELGWDPQIDLNKGLLKTLLS